MVDNIYLVEACRGPEEDVGESWAEEEDFKGALNAGDYIAEFLDDRTGKPLDTESQSSQRRIAQGTRTAGFQSGRRRGVLGEEVEGPDPSQVGERRQGVWGPQERTGREGLQAQKYSRGQGRLVRRNSTLGGD